MIYINQKNDACGGSFPPVCSAIIRFIEADKPLPEKYRCGGISKVVDDPSVAISCWERGETVSV
ncbi:hypothetical protein HLI03_10350 [Rhizobium laguerreae]|uniref:hypothetical protein n=1 Tax=Rhizobium laguerreae TaxID=1076926 RepID=UPI00147943BA|nr:hypothetical protein [Rhizobium laguerreae]NNH42060.1 hypothetical protein [Rhizobium laguerreae]NNH57270.1 hypothetical protein [Rhizobium laguerreae]